MTFIDASLLESNPPRRLTYGRMEEIVAIYDALLDVESPPRWARADDVSAFLGLIGLRYEDLSTLQFRQLEHYESCMRMHIARQGLVLRLVSGRLCAVPVGPAVLISETAFPSPTKDTPMAQNAYGPSADTKKLVALPTASMLTSELKSSLETAAWRTAGEQAVKLIRDSIVARIRAKGDEKTAPLASFLDSEEGLMAVATFVGYAVLFSSALDGDPRVSRLATSMRADSAKFVTDAIAEHVMGPITSAFATVLAGVPALDEKP